MGVGSPLPARSSAASFYRIIFFIILEAVESILRRRPVLEKGDHAQTTYLYYGKYVIY